LTALKWGTNAFRHVRPTARAGFAFDQ